MVVWSSFPFNFVIDIYSLPNNLHGATHCKICDTMYMCIQLTRVLYSVAIPRQSNPHISQFNIPCNEFASF